MTDLQATKSHATKIPANRPSKSMAREEAMKFLYKCDVDKVFFFSAVIFDSHCGAFGLKEKVVRHMKAYVQGVLDNLTEINQMIDAHSANWSLSRMSSTDRSILRLACFELKFMDTPQKVVINESVDFAKKYGSSHSGKFVNGVLDAFATSLHQESPSSRSHQQAEANLQP